MDTFSDRELIFKDLHRYYMVDHLSDAGFTQ